MQVREEYLAVLQSAVPSTRNLLTNCFLILCDSHPLHLLQVL